MKGKKQNSREETKKIIIEEVKGEDSSQNPFTSAKKSAKTPSVSECEDSIPNFLVSIVEVDITKEDKKINFNPHKFKSMYAQMPNWQDADDDSYKNFASKILEQFYQILTDQVSKEDIKEYCSRIEFFWNIQKYGMMLVKYKGSKYPLKNICQRVKNYIRKNPDKDILFCVNKLDENGIQFDSSVKNCVFEEMNFKFDARIEK
mmetsp:Transcript_20410/g.22785  ORF Transcript_20410/g.22785 Transcript_20410/m.22785 type:complete len:203 (+) Transcript_20410:2-610(+)